MGLRFVDTGRDAGRVVVLLHDSPYPAEHLKELAAALAPTRRVILPDLPGYGESLAGAAPIDDAQRELEEVARGLQLGTVDVVGHGLGAYRALRLALAARVRVARVVTIGGFAMLDSQDRARARRQADLLAIGGDPCDLLLARGLPPAHRDRHPGDVERVRAWIHGAPRATWIAELEAQAGCEDLRPSLAALGANVLCLHGADDGLVPPARSEEIVLAAPRASLETLPCGHFALEELSDEVIPRVRAFLLA